MTCPIQYAIFLLRRASKYFHLTFWGGFLRSELKYSLQSGLKKNPTSKCHFLRYKTKCFHSRCLILKEVVQIFQDWIFNCFHYVLVLKVHFQVYTYCNLEIWFIEASITRFQVKIIRLFSLMDVVEKKLVFLTSSLILHQFRLGIHSFMEGISVLSISSTIQQLATGTIFLVLPLVKLFSPYFVSVQL